MPWVSVEWVSFCGPSADPAGNIAEHLVYIVRGTDVRHAALEQIEREALAGRR